MQLCIFSPSHLDGADDAAVAGFSALVPPPAPSCQLFLGHLVALPARPGPENICDGTSVEGAKPITGPIIHSASTPSKDWGFNIGVSSQRGAWKPCFQTNFDLATVDYHGLSRIFRGAYLIS